MDAVIAGTCSCHGAPPLRCLSMHRALGARIRGIAPRDASDRASSTLVPASVILLPAGLWHTQGNEIRNTVTSPSADVSSEETPHPQDLRKH